MDKISAFKDLLLIKKLFKKYEIPFFLSYGTCLGAYRDGDFLPDDDDIDLVVTKKIDYKTRKDIGWTLYGLGFEPQGVAFNVFNRLEPSEVGYNGDAHSGIIVCERSIHVTIFFFGEEYCKEHKELEMVCIPKMGAYKLISSPSKFYNKPSTIKFKNEEFFVPSPTEEYLSYTYEDWKNPLKRDHGKLYNQIHSEGKMLKNIGSSFRAVSQDSPRKHL